MIVHRLDRCLIQCAMPAFEGLFPSEHDQVIQTLLFRLAQWHALAKLWLHTDHSLWLLDEASRLLGDQLCNNQNFTCTAFKTVELTSEAAARWREQACSLHSTLPGSSKISATSTAQPKTFNLATYKLHALGDYVHSIHLFGTMDSYTTQLVSNFRSSEHHETESQNDWLTLVTRENNHIVFLRVFTKIRTRKTQWDSWWHKNGGIHISKGNMDMIVLKLAWWIQMKQPLHPFDAITFCLIRQKILLIWPNIFFNAKVIQLSRSVPSILICHACRHRLAYMSVISRISSQGLRTTFFHDCWITSMMEMNRSLPVKSETLFISWTISTGLYNRNTFRSTTWHTTSATSKTRFIQDMVHLLWCSHENMALALILFGTHKYSVPCSFQSTIVVWVKWWKSYGWDGL